MFQYDWELEIWTHTCRACGKGIAAHTKPDLLYAWDRHTHSTSCLNGY